MRKTGNTEEESTAQKLQLPVRLHLSLPPSCLIRSFLPCEQKNTLPTILWVDSMDSTQLSRIQPTSISAQTGRAGTRRAEVWMQIFDLRFGVCLWVCDLNFKCWTLTRPQLSEDRTSVSSVWHTGGFSLLMLLTHFAVNAVGPSSCLEFWDSLNSWSRRATPEPAISDETSLGQHQRVRSETTAAGRGRTQMIHETFNIFMINA